MTFLPEWARDWVIPVMVAFAPLVGLEFHHLQEKARKRRREWSDQRRALRALRAIQAPRSIP